MTTTVGIRDIARNVSLLSEYDYVGIEDKKTHESKGLFVSPKYAEEIKHYIYTRSLQRAFRRGLKCATSF